MEKAVIAARLAILSFALLAMAHVRPQREPLRPAVSQVPFNTLKATATFKIGKNADWVAIGPDSVWVAGTGPFTLQRIDPKLNSVVATIELPDEACSGLALGFHSVWIPLCGKPNALARVDMRTKKITLLSIGPAGEEGGIAVSHDSVWLISDDVGTLSRINPQTNAVRQKIKVPAGSYNPVYSNGRIWITSPASNGLTAVDASTGVVIKTVSVGPQPRFLAAGGGSVWTLNQGDGSVTRVDEKAFNVSATIDAKIPGKGGDIAYGYGSVWTTVFGKPLTRIDARSNRIIRQWTGPGGDSLRPGFNSIWITDYRQGLLVRIPVAEVRRAGHE